MTQREVVSRPPAYYTSDWDSARQSVERIAALEPEVLATGHGRALRGPGMRRALHDLADRFDRYMPRHGRYVEEPALADERGVVYVPPRGGLSPLTVAGVSVAAVLATAMVVRARR
jgi:hypothetical protein